MLCYDYKNTLQKFIEIFPPDSIEDIDIHTVLTYGEYKIDICDISVKSQIRINRTEVGRKSGKPPTVDFPFWS